MSFLRKFFVTISVLLTASQGLYAEHEHEHKKADLVFTFFDPAGPEALDRGIVTNPYVVLPDGKIEVGEQLIGGRGSHTKIVLKEAAHGLYVVGYEINAPHEILPYEIYGDAPVTVHESHNDTTTDIYTFIDTIFRRKTQLNSTFVYTRKIPNSVH